MGLFSLVVYGVGDMVGAGIYATIGQAASQPSSCRGQQNGRTISPIGDLPP